MTKRITITLDEDQADMMAYALEMAASRKRTQAADAQRKDRPGMAKVHLEHAQRIADLVDMIERAPGASRARTIAILRRRAGGAPETTG